MHFDGIYYDMIAAVEPEPCYDRSHNHSMGGGHFWTQGNSKIFKEVREKIEGREGLIFTESQDEAYIGDVDLFLTLLGYRRGELPYVGNPKDESQRYKIVPAYLSIYDGFAMYAGHDMNGTYW